MDRKTAVNVTWALENLFDLGAILFKIPQRAVAEGQEKPAPRFGVVTSNGDAFGSVSQVREYFALGEGGEE